MGLLLGGHLAKVAAGVNFVVALGADRTETDVDTTSPFDSRAGYRITATLDQETGNSPPGGGPITSWTFDNLCVTPAGFTPSDFEYKWEAVSNTADAVNSPVAVSTFEDLGTLKTWDARQTTQSSGTRVIDVTVREKADVSNTDTVRITFNVTGVL